MYVQGVTAKSTVHLYYINRDLLYFSLLHPVLQMFLNSSSIWKENVIYVYSGGLDGCWLVVFIVCPFPYLWSEPQTLSRNLSLEDHSNTFKYTFSRTVFPLKVLVFQIQLTWWFIEQNGTSGFSYVRLNGYFRSKLNTK